MSSEQKRGEAEQLTFSNKLDQLTAWVKNLPAIRELLNNPERYGPFGFVQGIAEQIGNCFPIDGGDGNGTIQQEVDFWFDNQQAFTDFFENRAGAVKIFKQWDQLQCKITDLKSKVVEINNELVMFGLRPTGDFKRQQTERQELFEKINTLEIQLKEIMPEFEQYHSNLTNIISHIDCKLLTVLFGKILESLGWNIAMFCNKKPFHPYLQISSVVEGQEPAIFITDWFAKSGEYRSIPVIRRYDRIYTVHAKREALKLGVISENEDWPLSFTKATFDRFDQWFLDHQQQ